MYTKLYTFICILVRRRIFYNTSDFIGLKGEKNGYFKSFINVIFRITISKLVLQQRRADNLQLASVYKKNNN